MILDTLDGHAHPRNLTPEEYEMLQGFPVGWTDIETDKGPASDYQRYKAVGNAMPVPVLAWLGQKIQALESSP